MHDLRRLIFLIPVLLTLVACNLSAGSSVPTVTNSVIVTATSPSTTSVEAESIESTSESDPDSDETTERISTSNTTSQQVNNSASVVSSDTTSDLYYVYGDQRQGQCSVQAQPTTNIRVGNNTNADIVGQLIAGEWIPVVRIIDGWYQIDLSGTPVHRMWISSDPTNLDSRCECDANGCYMRRYIPTPNPQSDLYYTGNPQPYPPEGCFVYTAGDFPVNIRVAQSETATRIGQLRANQWIPVDSFVNGWFGINLPNTPIDGAYIASGPAQLTSTCRCDEFSCTPITPSSNTTCYISTLSADKITKVHTDPGNWTTVVGQLVHGEQYKATTQSTSGWYQLEIGGWVPSNYLGLASESCRNLPTIDYGHPDFKCELVNTTGEIQTIYTEPNGDYYGRFGSGLRLGLIKQEGDWNQVYVPAFNSAGWVKHNNMTISGPCVE